MPKNTGYARNLEVGAFGGICWHIARVCRGSFREDQEATAFEKGPKYLNHAPAFLSGVEGKLMLVWDRRICKIRPHFKRVSEVLRKDLEFIERPS